MNWETNHFHFIIWAANGRSGDNFTEVTYVDVIAADSEQAVAKAKRLISGRQHYWINSVVEHHDHREHTNERQEK